MRRLVGVHKAYTLGSLCALRACRCARVHTLSLSFARHDAHATCGDAMDRPFFVIVLVLPLRSCART